MIAYYGDRISPHMTDTPEGYLICHDVPIARTGDQDYLARELELDGDPERLVKVKRYPEDVFEAATIASFEGKDVTAGHPPENVGPENFSAYSKGHVENVRRVGDFIVADLHIKDAGLISDIKNHVVREVSCGYLCNYVPDGDGYKQTHIRGNHVAVVPRGRAGREVAIKDHAAGEAEKGRNQKMSEFWKSILTAFGMAAKDASPEELQQMAETTAAALDAAPAEKAPEAKPAAEEPPAKEDPPAKENPAAPKDAAPCSDNLEAKLDKLLELLSSKQEEPSGEDALDALMKKLCEKPGEGSAETIPAEEMEDACMSDAAKDAAINILKAMRPVVAKIEDKAVRAQVADALVSSIKAPDVMGSIAKAAQGSAQKAADAAKKTNYEKICEEQKAEYDARNPHKQKKEA